MDGSKEDQDAVVILQRAPVTTVRFGNLFSAVHRHRQIRHGRRADLVLDGVALAVVSQNDVELVRIEFAPNLTRIGNNMNCSEVAILCGQTIVILRVVELDGDGLALDRLST